MESWKKYQKQKKSNTHVQRLFQIVIAMAILLVIFAIARLMFWFYSGSNRNSYSYFESVSWKSDNQINILVGSKLLFGLDPVFAEIKIVHLEEPLKKDEIQLYSKQHFIVLDAYIANGESVETIDEAKSYIRNAIIDDSYQTNLSRSTIFRIWRFLSSDKNTQYMQDMVMLPESAIRQEDLKIRVQNGTTVPGLATEQAVWVENLGASVIDVGNANQTYEKSRVVSYVENKEYHTLRRLEQIFGTEVDYRPSEDPQRVEVDIIIGKDVLLK